MFKSSLSLFLFSFFICFLNWNCTKIDNTNIGAELLPAVDNVNTFDTTIEVIANNFDSVLSDCSVIYPADDHSLGCINSNPLFGTTKSIIYIELKPSVFPFKFPDNRTLDSVVLVLSYKNSFGDTTIPQKVNVYQISGSFKPDTSSCRFYDFNPQLLGSATYAPQQLNDSVKAFREASSHQLRIKLNNIFSQALVSQDSSTAFKSDSAFKDFFKGFAIVPDSNFGGNAVSYFNLADTNTKLSVYLKSVTGTVTDTLVYNFRLSGLSATANYIGRNHSGAEIANHLQQPTQGDDLIYIQTTPGTYAEINIPGLSTLSNRIIHRAVLTMDQVYSDNTVDNVFSTPDILFIDLLDTGLTRKFKTIPCDFNIASGTPNTRTFGGFRTSAKDIQGHNISRYTFDISRYIQKIATTHRLNSKLRLRAPDNIINTLAPYLDDCGQGVSPFFYPLNIPAYGQVKLGGGNNPNYKMKLYIVYSNI